MESLQENLLFNSNILGSMALQDVLSLPWDIPEK